MAGALRALGYLETREGLPPILKSGTAAHPTTAGLHEHRGSTEPPPVPTQFSHVSLLPKFVAVIEGTDAPVKVGTWLSSQLQSSPVQPPAPKPNSLMPIIRARASIHVSAFSCFCLESFCFRPNRSPGTKFNPSIAVTRTTKRNRSAAPWRTSRASVEIRSRRQCPKSDKQWSRPRPQFQPQKLYPRVSTTVTALVSWQASA